MSSPPLEATSRTPHPRWWRSLKLRLMLASTLLIAVCVAVSALVVLHRVEDRSEQALLDLERDNAERIAALLSQRVVSLQKMLRVTASALPEAALTDADAAKLFLERSPALAVNFAAVFIIAADGHVMAAHNGNSVSQPELSMGDRDYFRRTMQQAVPLVAGPLPGRFSREPVIQLTMPVQAQGGRSVGVLMGSMRLASRNLFDDLTYSDSRANDGVQTLITDAGGIIISHPRRDRVMQSLDSEPGMQEAVSRWSAQGRPVEPSGQALREQGHLIAMAGVPGADWMVFRIAPDGDLMGGVVQARREALQWAASVAMIGGLLLLALLAWMLGPLSRLRERALALQDNSLPIDQGWPRSGGEIGELSDVLRQVLREREQGERANRVLARQMESVLAAAPIGVALTQEGRFVLTGTEFNSLTGWPAGELAGRLGDDLLANPADSTVAKELGAGRQHMAELQLKRRDGSLFWGRLQGRPVDPADPQAGSIWLLEDVTERREARERLAWSAHHDTLTRLFNRAAFEQRLDAWVAGGHQGRPASLLFIDLDHFKQINDNAGHAAGDGVLREVATRLQELVRGGDAVARLGGDEFALLLPECAAAVALPLAERLRAAVTRVGVHHEGRRLNVGASIGVVQIDPAAGSTAATWLARADAACYAAKHAGRDAVRLAEGPQPAALAVPA